MPALSPSPLSPDAADLERLMRIEALAETAPRRAADLARRALQDGLRHPLLNEVVARRLAELGRFDEAIVAYGEGLALDTERLSLIIGVGFCLLKVDRFDEARAVFGTAVRLDPNNAAACYGLGGACERTDDLALAERWFAQALQLDPAHAGAHSALASLALRRGDMARARNHASRALALDPRQADAHLTLARADLAEGRLEAAEGRLEALLSWGPASARVSGEARVLLGDALDALGRPDQAWKAYLAGKAELRRLHAPAYGPQRGETALDEALRLAREFAALPAGAFGAAPPAPPAPSPGAPAVHVFLVGFPRSGTTLLGQVLASHEAVAILEEKPTLAESEQLFLGPGGLERLAALDEEALAARRATYWRKVESHDLRVAGKVFVDKTPLGSLSLPIIARLFPDARILFAVRDPRDVVLSCFRRSFRMNQAMFQFLGLESAARYYDAVMAVAALYRRGLPLAFHTVRHERVVEDFEAEIGAACAFLGLEWTGALAGFAEAARARAIATPSALQVLKGLNREGLGVWRRYRSALTPVRPWLDPWVTRHGYDPD